MNRWKYRTVPTSTLRATKTVLSKVPLCWLFANQLTAIELELLDRELSLIADESGGYLVAWILGIH